MKEVKLVLNAAALITFVVAIGIGAEYIGEVTKGSEPSRVYRMVALGSGHVIVMDCATG